LNNFEVWFFSFVWFDLLFRILIMSGDGGVVKAINLIIELIGSRNNVLNQLEQIKNNLNTPLCIIPCGSTNTIANTIYGTDDQTTPLMYLIRG
jgi:diacylglycerol kinase family enzyme